jgi:sulfatase maturation enzyme AslB (radical SAM superfamily)
MKPTVFLLSLVERKVATPLGGLIARLYERLREADFRWRKKDKPSEADAGLKGRFCAKPFESIEMQENGSIYLCCPVWVPTRAGNLVSGNAREIWNSQRAQAIRAAILDGSFAYCDKAMCPEIQAGTLPTVDDARKDPRYRAIIDAKQTVIAGIPRFINMAHDRSCNLSCPSCRTQKISHVKGAAYNLTKKLHDKLVDEFLGEPSAQDFTLSVTGSGDPFGSRIFREFLRGFDGAKFPNMKLNLQTNGVLLNAKEWKRIEKLHANVNAVIVSFDAASAATYDITRRGGHWGELIKNMAMIGALRREGTVKYLRLDYVVQDVNFREMEDFVKLAKTFSPDVIYFSRAAFWGTWTRAEFREKCVWEPAHPAHAEFVEMISRPVFDDPLVTLGNLSQYRRQALAQAAAE